jgi:hypothetical protein
MATVGSMPIAFMEKEAGHGQHQERRMPGFLIRLDISNPLS